MNKFHALFRLAVIAIMALFAASCGQTPEYRNAVPSNAFFVYTMDNQALLQKANDGQTGPNPLTQFLSEKLSEIPDIPAEEKEYLLSLINNPSESGLDLSQPSYLFMALDEENFAGGIEGGLLYPMGDASKFTQMAGLFSLHQGAEIEQEGDLSIITLDDSGNPNLLCVYNETACLFFIAQQDYPTALDRAKELMMLKQENSLFDDKAATECLSKSNDMNIYLDYGNLPSEFFNQFATTSPIIQALEEFAVAGSCNFEKGRITFEGAPLFKSKEAQEKFLEVYNYSQAQTGDLLPYIPKDNIAVLSCNLIGEKLYETLVSLPGYGAMAAVPSVKQVFDAIDGDVALVITGVTADGKYPEGAILTTVNDPAIIEALVAELGPLPITMTGKNTYQLALGNIVLNFGVKDKILYITNASTVLSAIQGEKIESIESAKQLFVKQNSTLTLDFGKLTQAIRPYLANSPESETQIIFGLLGIFQQMEIHGTTETASMVIEMTDTNRNALATLCSMLTDLAKSAQSQM